MLINSYPEAVIRCRVQHPQASFVGNVDKSTARAAPMVFASAQETGARSHASSRTRMRCCATFLVVVVVVAMNDCTLGAVNSIADLAGQPVVDETASGCPWASRKVRTGEETSFERPANWADRPFHQLLSSGPTTPAPATPRRLLQSCPLLSIPLLFLSTSTIGARAYGE